MPMPKEQVLTMPDDKELNSYARLHGISVEQARNHIESIIERRRIAFAEADKLVESQVGKVE